MAFKPIVSSLVINQEFRWLGKLGFRGIFDGEHIFRLLDNQDGSTTLIHKERFSGLLVGLLNLSATEQGFILMNKKVKELAEKGLN